MEKDMNDKQFEALLESIQILADNVAKLDMTLFSIHDRLFYPQIDDDDEDEDDESVNIGGVE